MSPINVINPRRARLLGLLLALLASSGVARGESGDVLLIRRGLEVEPVRLVEINDTAVRKAVTKEARSDNALNRELNLTWTTELQEDNRIQTGQWWQPDDTGKPVVSVESKLAKRMGIKMGDELRFAVGEQRFSAEVASIRSVQ